MHNVDVATTADKVSMHQLNKKVDGQVRKVMNRGLTTYIKLHIRKWYRPGVDITVSELAERCRVEFHTVDDMTVNSAVAVLARKEPSFGLYRVNGTRSGTYQLRGSVTADEKEANEFADAILQNLTALVQLANEGKKIKEKLAEIGLTIKV